MRWPWRWWGERGRQVRLTGLHVRLYTRAGCHLCEDAWRLLDDRRRHYGFTLESVNVDADPDLTTRYGEWVPVVTVNGKDGKGPRKAETTESTSCSGPRSVPRSAIDTTSTGFFLASMIPLKVG